MKYLILSSLLISSAAWAKMSKEQIEELAVQAIIVKFRQMSAEKFYGISGRSPRSEQELLGSCNRMMLPEFDQVIQSKRKYVAAGTYDQIDDLVANFNYDDWIKDEGVSHVIGYCDVQSPEGHKKCNWKSDTNCSAANSIYSKGLKELSKDRSILYGTASEFCAKFMKTLARDHKLATSELEMCRLEEEEVKSKSAPQKETEKVADYSDSNVGQEIILEFNDPQPKPKKTPVRNTAPASINFGSSKASRQ